MPGKRLVSVSVVATLLAVASAISISPAAAVAQDSSPTASQSAGPFICTYAPGQAGAIAAKISAGVPLATACSETGSTSPTGSQAPAINTAPGLCAGAFQGSVTHGDFNIISGKLDWDFYFNFDIVLDTPFNVTMTMPNAWVDGSAINAPYAPHIQPASYDFHASMLNYQWIGTSGGGTLRPGNVLTLSWAWNRFSSSRDSWVIGGAGVSCTVPNGV